MSRLPRSPAVTTVRADGSCIDILFTTRALTLLWSLAFKEHDAGVEMAPKDLKRRELQKLMRQSKKPILSDKTTPFFWRWLPLPL